MKQLSKDGRLIYSTGHVTQEQKETEIDVVRKSLQARFEPKCACATNSAALAGVMNDDNHVRSPTCIFTIFTAWEKVK